MAELWEHAKSVIPAVLLLLALLWPVAIIVAKMGFPRWMGWTMGVTVLVLGAIESSLGGFCYVVFLFLLALREWPVHRQLMYAKVRASLATEADAYELLGEAVHLERKGRLEEAIDRYQQVHEKFQEAPPGKDAAIAIERLKGKSASLGWPQAGPDKTAGGD